MRTIPSPSTRFHPAWKPSRNVRRTPSESAAGLPLQLAPDSDPWSLIPPRFNLGLALTRGNVLAGRGSRVCLDWESSSGRTRQITYDQLDAETNRLASALAKLGVQRGDRVLLRLPNLPEFYIAALAVAKLGGVFIPTSTLFRATEIAYRLRDSGAVAVVTTARLADEVRTARAEAPTLRHVIVVSSEGATAQSGELDFEPLLASGAEQFQAADTAADDMAFIAYTSGTTGDPKGVVHLHQYALAYDTVIRHWHDYRDDDVCACPAELGWMLPVASTFLFALRAGVCVVLQHPEDGRFDPAAWFDLIERKRITNFVGTPTIYRMLTAHAAETGSRITSLRHGVSAGEPLPADTIEAVRRGLGFTVLDGLGMSECFVYCFNRAGDDVLPGSCGRPGPGLDIRLLDDALREVPMGDEGVLCVRRAGHAGMMREYWNKSEQTDEVLCGEWYFSGDTAVRDSDGRYWFRGRNDDLIKASGYRISPFEVESCLVSHPAVLEAAAVASPDALRGDVVKAFLVLRPGHVGTPELAAELQAWVREHSAPYKYPRKVEFVAELPKTQSGKIKRKLLRQRERAACDTRAEHHSHGACESVAESAKESPKNAEDD